MLIAKSILLISIFSLSWLFCSLKEPANYEEYNDEYNDNYDETDYRKGEILRWILLAIAVLLGIVYSILSLITWGGLAIPVIMAVIEGNLVLMDKKFNKFTQKRRLEVGSVKIDALAIYRIITVVTVIVIAIYVLSLVLNIVNGGGFTVLLEVLKKYLYFVHWGP